MDNPGLPWSILDSHDNLDDLVDTWYRLFHSVINLHLPLKTCRVELPKQLDWIDSEILSAMHTRDTFARARDFTNWKIWKIIVNGLIKKEGKKSYYTTILNKQFSGSYPFKQCENPYF